MVDVFVKVSCSGLKSTETSSFYYLNIIKKLRVSQAFDGDGGPSSDAMPDGSQECWRHKGLEENEKRRCKKQSCVADGKNRGDLACMLYLW